MDNSRAINRGSRNLWRWLTIIVGVNVLLIAGGFLVPAGDDQINIAAIQHLLRSQGVGQRGFRPTVAYVRTQEPVSPDAREALSAFGSYLNVEIRWLGDDALMALEAERNIDRGGYLFSLSAPSHGVLFSSIDAETSVTTGGGRSELVFFHWMGVSQVWRERDAQ